MHNNNTNGHNNSSSDISANFSAIPTSQYILSPFPPAPPADGSFEAKRKHVADLVLQLGPPKIMSLDNLPTNAEQYQELMPGTRLVNDLKHFMSRIKNKSRRDIYRRDLHPRCGRRAAHPPEHREITPRSRGARYIKPR